MAHAVRKASASKRRQDDAELTPIDEIGSAEMATRRRTFSALIPNIVAEPQHGKTVLERLLEVARPRRYFFDGFGDGCSSSVNGALLAPQCGYFASSEGVCVCVPYPSQYGSPSLMA